jgi:23S rRNA pseudouridine1911/1915/1917 synthase
LVGQTLRVLYEDQAIVVVDKPAGIHTAPLAARDAETLLALVLSVFPEISSVPGVKPQEHGLLHRLDRDTSGVVVIARTASAFAALRSQFSSGLARKEYRAACACPTGSDFQERLSIASRFAPAGPGRRMVRVVPPEETSGKRLKEATRSVYTTEAWIIERKAGRALMGIVIQKGFRHQVRAHLSHAGWPILGDIIYGAPAPPDAPQRMYLHAISVSITHPDTGKALRVASSLPEVFRTVMSSGTV